MSDVPAPTAVAAEIHTKFNRKMKSGGRIDQILNGGEPVVIRPALPDSELAVMKRSIGVQLDEYAVAIKEAKAWIRGWLDRRRPSGFRKTKR